MQKLNFWFEFGSTYSYLSAMRIDVLAQEKQIDIIWRPFLLGPIFKTFGWDTSPFKIYTEKGEYMWRDMERRADKLGLPPITRPDPFPQHSLLAARIATSGAGESWLPAFVKGVYKKQYGEGCSISDENILFGILKGLGLDGSAIIERAKTDREVKDTLRVATEEAQALGLFGAPSFITSDGELFWGDDRLEDAIDWEKTNAKKD